MTRRQMDRGGPAFPSARKWTRRDSHPRRPTGSPGGSGALAPTEPKSGCNTFRRVRDLEERHAGTALRLDGACGTARDLRGCAARNRTAAVGSPRRLPLHRCAARSSVPDRPPRHAGAAFDDPSGRIVRGSEVILREGASRSDLDIDAAGV